MARTKIRKGKARASAAALERPAKGDCLVGAARIRWGLCCQFANQPIRFRTATATALLRLTSAGRRAKLAQLCLANAEALLESLEYCAANGIGCFRVASTILPTKTHPAVGYSIEDLPNSAVIVQTFKECGAFAAEHKIRTVFHPDQFVVLNSPNADVFDKAIQDLEYQAEVAEWVQADVINIHGGGAYGDKAVALETFARNLERLSPAVRLRLTVENDDKIFTPSDLLPVCRAAGLNSWEPSFRRLGQAAEDQGDGFFRLRRESSAAINPQCDRFAGKVFVLVDAANSSATFRFASLAQQHGLATLVGQPTGGNQRGINGGAMYFLLLPKSQIELDIPLIGYFPEGRPPDAGLTPDVIVVPTIEEIADGRDAVLDKARELARPLSR